MGWARLEIDSTRGHVVIDLLKIQVFLLIARSLVVELAVVLVEIKSVEVRLRRHAGSLERLPLLDALLILDQVTSQDGRRQYAIRVDWIRLGCHDLYLLDAFDCWLVLC